jgi:hypothetical protein
VTVQELIEASLTLCGRLGMARGAGAAESAKCLTFLNRLIDNYNAQRWFVIGLDQVAVAITSGTRSYALATRPIHIERAEFLITAGGITNWPVPVKVMGVDEFNSIPTQGIVSPFPVGLWCDYGATTATIYIAPVPAAGALKLYTWQVISAFATLADSVTMPPGIVRALIAGVAAALAAATGLPLTPALVAEAADARGAMESLAIAHTGTVVKA